MLLVTLAIIVAFVALAFAWPVLAGLLVRWQQSIAARRAKL